METCPPVPTWAMTMLGMVSPVVKLRFDAFGREVPAGQTVTKLSDVGFVTVTLRATATAPDAGTPPRLVTVRLRVWPGPTLPPPENCPSMVGPPGRVSRRRAGTNDVIPEPFGNQP